VLSYASCGRLVQLGADAVERRVQLGAERLDGHDDRDRDTGGDQTVFDGGCAIFIAKESLKQSAHVWLPSTALLAFTGREIHPSVYEGMKPIRTVLLRNPHCRRRCARDRRTTGQDRDEAIKRAIREYGIDDPHKQTRLAAYRWPEAPRRAGSVRQWKVARQAAA